MTVRTINYQRTYSLAPYQNERLGVEIELNDDESVEEAFKLAKETVESYKTEPQPSQTEAILAPIATEEANYTTRIPKPPVNKREQLIQQHISAIGTCTDVETLKIYEFISKNYPEIREAYETKLNSLI